MKLDHDLIRELLLALEDITDGFQNIHISHIQERYLPDYDLKAIYYHVKQLSQAGLIQTPGVSSKHIIDITWYGHQYLANIKNDSIWSKTKEIIKPVGTVTLDVVAEIAKTLVLKSLTPNS